MSAPGKAAELSSVDRAFLLRLQQQALQYFLDNQVPSGLILDRQRNRGPRQQDGLCSTAATGMGFLALALASLPPYRLLSPRAAALRIRAGLQTALDRLPQDHGVLPHFIDSATGGVCGSDAFSTVDTAWLLAGALGAGALLGDAGLEAPANRLYQRVDWHHWTAAGLPGPRCLLRHAKGWDGHFLGYSWDRLNGETLHLYVLAAGAADGRAISPACGAALRPFYGMAAGRCFNNADLGLFVFQYGLELLDLKRWQAPVAVDLAAEARLATRANRLACQEAADRFLTYRRFWGLSPGDGPGDPPETDTYRCYAPGGLIDGTAHLTATLASVAHDPEAVLQNLWEGEHHCQGLAHGRYGFSSLNLDRCWVGRDMVGIDAGAVVLALDNYLMDGRVRAVFSGLPWVRRGLPRMGFTPLPGPAAGDGPPDQRPTIRRAS